MTNNCDSSNNISPIFRGDSVSFGFEFKDSDEAPINISGMTLFFSMKEQKISADGLAGDLQHKVTFPDSDKSISGIGGMEIPALKTSTLNGDVGYHFDFQLISGNIVTTLASGIVQVLQDVTKTISLT